MDIDKSFFWEQDREASIVIDENEQLIAEQMHGMVQFDRWTYPIRGEHAYMKKNGQRYPEQYEETTVHIGSPAEEMVVTYSSDHAGDKRIVRIQANIFKREETDLHIPLGMSNEIFAAFTPKMQREADEWGKVVQHELRINDIALGGPEEVGLIDHIRALGYREVGPRHWQKRYHPHERRNA
jgi:hypothetical protein